MARQRGELAPEIPGLNVTDKSSYIDEELALLLPDFMSGSKDAATTLADLENALNAR